MKFRSSLLAPAHPGGPGKRAVKRLWYFCRFFNSSIRELEGGVDCVQTLTLVKAGGPLGLSIVGGQGHTSHPFGVDHPGVFISKVRTAFTTLWPLT